MYCLYSMDLGDALKFYSDLGDALQFYSFNILQLSSDCSDMIGRNTKTSN